ncbi:MAG: hypothetical protein H6655_15020 [Ardenticatenaceae bacterium]|nr:hypothetical protein [Ardenticatenaceae bacterium]
MKPTLRGGLAGLLATAVLLIILIAAGVFDPKPVGTLQASLPVASLSLNQPGQTVVWLEDPLPAGNFSVRGTAVYQQGNLDSGVGLALGSQADAFVVAVSPLGYVLVQQGEALLLPWQPWPHVGLAEAPNELWLDVRGESVTVRLNRELLWQGTLHLAARQLGLFGEGFGGETAVYTFPSLQIYSEPD